MDKLARDAKNALKMGMSYGQYMAQKKPEIIIPKKPKEEMRECQRCGTLFPLNGRTGKKFCSDDCRNQFFTERRNQARMEQMQEIHNICPICEKGFVTTDPRRKYCGEFCARVAASEQCKQSQRRKKEGMNNGDKML